METEKVLLALVKVINEGHVVLLLVTEYMNSVSLQVLVIVNSGTWNYAYPSPISYQTLEIVGVTILTVVYRTQKLLSII